MILTLSPRSSAMQNPNVTQYAGIFDAELASLRRDNNNAEKDFEFAMAHAQRRGLTQDRALAHERFAEHFVRLGASYRKEAAHHMAEALRLYEEWGAHAKVLLLQSTFESVLAPPQEIELELQF